MSEAADSTFPADSRSPADGLPYRMVRPYRLRFEESTADETIRTAVHLAWADDVARLVAAKA